MATLDLDPYDRSHAVLVWMKLADEQFGEEEELDALYDLEDLIGEHVAAAGVGHVDGHEIGSGECYVLVYGPNADLVGDVVLAMAREGALPAGAWMVKHYGELGAAREERVELPGPGGSV